MKERLTHPLRSHGHDVLPALKNVSFEVPRGEFFGIVGPNGSGKSTLLRCIARIYPPDSGRIEVKGSIAPFIELGVGFNDELSAYDNAFINAVMLGMTRRQARGLLAEIIQFAGLEEFADMKLKNFSSGMVVRLAFSITAQVSADVLLFDEVLAVGDAAFQQKCLDRFQSMKDQGRSVLLVTHDMGQVERFCDRAMLLDGGEIVDIGEPSSIARLYNRLNVERVPRPTARGSPDEGSGAVEIGRAWVEGSGGERVDSLAQGERCDVCVEAIMHEPVEEPVFTVTLRDASHRIVFVTSSQWLHGSTGLFSSGQRAVARIRFDNWLAPGRYSVCASVSLRVGAALGARDEIALLTVHGTRVTGSVVDLPHEFEVERR